MRRWCCSIDSTREPLMSLLPPDPARPRARRPPTVNASHPARRALLACGLLAALAGCAQAPTAGPAVADALQRPAERQLLLGLRAYDEARYADAEAALLSSLGQGLAHPRDRAAAHKTLAFIYCTSERLTACEAAFRQARQADPAFELLKSEAGHPLWGPVYQASRR